MGGLHLHSCKTVFVQGKLELGTFDDIKLMVGQLTLFAMCAEHERRPVSKQLLLVYTKLRLRRWFSHPGSFQESWRGGGKWRPK